MKHLRARTRVAVLLAAGVGALAVAGSAFAHAEISPPVTVANVTQLFTLAVPTEKEDAETVKVELAPPSGFSIDSFVPSPGWQRQVRQTGSGEETEIKSVTWTGEKVPPEEDAVFQFLATADSSKTYSVAVRQTYSDGSVVDWSGSQSSDTPAPGIEAKSSLGGGATDAVAIVALVVGVIALLVAAAALLARSGRRSLA
jgi:uncharacterized protein YcnI